MIVLVNYAGDPRATGWLGIVETPIATVAKEKEENSGALRLAINHWEQPTTNAEGKFTTRFLRIERTSPGFAGRESIGSVGLARSGSRGAGDSFFLCNGPHQVHDGIECRPSAWFGQKSDFAKRQLSVWTQAALKSEGC